uniref:Gamma-glutamyl hydrolase n=1 Tax=Rhizophora mucronata TaxID=61149 RepID=A0A2P2KEC0_RHIMU
MSSMPNRPHHKPNHISAWYVSPYKMVCNMLSHLDGIF